MKLKVEFGDKVRKERDALGKDFIVVGFTKNICMNCVMLKEEKRNCFRCLYYPEKSIKQNMQSCKGFEKKEIPL